MTFNFENFSFDLLQVFCREDYYTILGVKKDASDKEIKKAFRSIKCKHVHILFLL